MFILRLQALLLLKILIVRLVFDLLLTIMM